MQTSRPTTAGNPSSTTRTRPINRKVAQVRIETGIQDPRGRQGVQKYETATTPFRRAIGHQSITDYRKEALADTYTGINPAAVQRQIQALTSELLTLTTSKAGPTTKARVTTCAPSNEATNQTLRAS